MEDEKHVSYNEPIVNEFIHASISLYLYGG